jgi:spermidine synthase
MLALLSYPILVEPNLRIVEQSRTWAVGYGALMVLTLGCAALLWRSKKAVAVAGPGGPEVAVEAPAEADAAPTFGQRMRWLALSFAPSSLLLGVTTYASTDLAAVPLLWIIPLALYLLTFVLVFARRPLVSHRVMLWIQPVLVLVITVIFHESLTEWLWAVLLLHLLMFFVTTLVCHGELARSRPSARHLTEFYIWMSVGGVLGGLFNALVAPVAFPSVVEYPLVIALACMLRPAAGPPGTQEGTAWPQGPGWLRALLRGLGWPCRQVAAARRASLVRWAEHPVRSRWLDLVLPLWLWFVLKELTNWFAPAYTGWIPVSGAALGVLLATGLIVPAYRSWAARLAVALPLLTLAGFLAWEWWLWRDPKHAQEALGAYGTKDWLWHARNYLSDQGLERLASLVKAEVLVLGLGALAAFVWVRRPVRFGMAIGVVFLVGHLWYGHEGAGVGGSDRVLYAGRSFFGVLRVKEDRSERTHTLVHGSTTHGVQSMEPDRCTEPWTYYHRNGPLGQVFETLIDSKKHRELGVIGLGTGTTAAYAEPGQTITYFEIDRKVEQIARNEDLFTYIYNAEHPNLDNPEEKGAQVDIILGDARLSLQDQPDGRFDILVVDAFSSDAIPIHLLTREAVALYFQKLKPDGILMVHVSNRYLELAPVVGNIAAELELTARVRNDTSEKSTGKYGSEWVVVVRRPQRLGELLGDIQWEEIPANERIGLWTDDFSNIITVLTWYRDVRAWIKERLGSPEP